MPKNRSLADFRPQVNNANKHTPRGMGALNYAMSDVGWFGAITTSADGETIDGSARLETAYTKFGDIEPIVFQIDGNRPVVLERVDIPDADDPKAKKISIAANRVAELNLKWESEVVLEVGEEIDLSPYFYDDEIDLMAGEVESGSGEDEDDRPLSFGGEDFGDKHALAIVLEKDEYEQWQQVKEAIGLKKDTKAFLELVKYYLEREL